MVIEPAFGTFGSVGRCQVLLENEISISIKLVSRRKHALKFPGRWLRWLWTSENTVDQHQQMTWQPKSSLTVETSYCTSSNMDSVPLHSSSRLWTLISKWNAKFTLIWKEDFGPLSNSPVLFLHSPGKTLLTLSLVQKWLVALFLKTSERGDSWCTDSSFSVFQLSQVFESALLDSILKFAVIPVACAPFFLPKFFLPVNFAFNMLWCSTL